MHTLGCLPDLPDHRDFMIHECEETTRIFNGDTLFPEDSRLSFRGDNPFVDHSNYCSPIENQGALGSCVAQACVGLLEYLQRRSREQHVDGSRLFVYKVARMMDRLRGDSGARIRTAMKSLKVFGVPPEAFWPYNVDKFDEEPTPFVYGFGQGYKVKNYYRFDKPSYDRNLLLSLLRSTIRYGLPVAFGFVVYDFGNKKGEFVVPEGDKRPIGGHAVLAVGYDDNRIIGKVKGALKIRNSWGVGWGEEGYGWLPYDYVTRGLSFDFWTVYSHEYVL